MMVLAHRGLWRHPAQRNTLGALTSALAEGFGLETDIRDHAGQLVISHDPPVNGDLLLFDDLLDHYCRSGGGILAINVKADGLQSELDRAVTKHRIPSDRYFVFDMAVPDALGYLARGIPCFTRESEVEPVPAFLDQAAGLWLDCFKEDWISEDVIRRHVDAGRRVALVSPELHGRDYEAVWACWRIVYRQLKSRGEGDRMFICTDLPEEARRFFDE